MAIIIKPKGKLDIVGAATLQQRIDKLVKFGTKTQKIWLIDLENVNYINHFGLSTLVVARRQAQNEGCRLLLRNLKPAVQMMLEIGQIQDWFEIIPPEVIGEKIHQSPPLKSAAPPQAHKTKVEVELETSPEEEEKAIALEVQGDSEQARSIKNLQKLLSNFKSHFS